MKFNIMPFSVLQDLKGSAVLQRKQYFSESLGWKIPSVPNSDCID